MNDPMEYSQIEWDTEDILLGAIMIQSAGTQTRDCINNVSKIVQYSDFKGFNNDKNPALWTLNSRIYYAMLKCPDPPHDINVALQMAKMGLLSKGISASLYHFQWMVPCSMDYMDYAKAVKDYATARQTKFAGEDKKAGYKRIIGMKSKLDEGITL